MIMLLLKTAGQVAGFIGRERKAGKSIGFVPTMGALHSGHISLIEKAGKENDLVICSIFVNPTQFNNPEDLENYPRDLKGDLAQLKKIRCDVIFHPEVGEIYPDGTNEVFDLGYLDKVMEGHFRPGHFQGVARVVKRFFEIVQPDRAYFGLKDYQQFLVVEKIVADFNLGVKIIGCETKRDPDGLAMSSRNRLLSKQQRRRATLFYKCLKKARKLIRTKSIQSLKDMVTEMFGKESGCRLEYFEVAEAHSLKPLEKISPKDAVVACIAGYVGNVRLIDNLILIP